MTLSLIIPVYNRANLLMELFGSILKNSATFEVIVVDDCSPDPEVEKIRGKISSIFPPHITLSWVRNDHNLGVAATTNRGLDLVKTEYFALVDCDDYLTHGAVDTLLEKLDTTERIDFGFTDRINYQEINRSYERIKYGNQRFLKKFSLKEALLFDMVASHLKFYRTQLIRDIGGFDVDCSECIDYEMAIRLAWRGYKYLYIDSPLYVHRIHANQSTETRWLLQVSQANIVRNSYLRKSINVDEKNTVYDGNDTFRKYFAENKGRAFYYSAITKGKLHEFTFFSELIDFANFTGQLEAVLFVPNTILPKDQLLVLYKASKGNLYLGIQAEFNAHTSWFCFYAGFFRKIYVSSPIEHFVFKSASYEPANVELVD